MRAQLGADPEHRLDDVDEVSAQMKPLVVPREFLYADHGVKRAAFARRKVEAGTGMRVVNAFVDAAWRGLFWIAWVAWSSNRVSMNPSPVQPAANRNVS